MFYITGRNSIVPVISFPFSVIFLVLASDAFLDQIVAFSARFGISERFTGTVIVSLISVVDEIAVASFSVISRHPVIGYGAIEGSTVITIFVFILIVPAFSTIYIKRYRKDGFFVLITSLVILAYYFAFHTIPWYAGFPLIIIFVTYMFVTYASQGRQDMDIERKGIVPAIAVFSFLVIFLSSDVLVNDTIFISSCLHVPVVYVSLYAVGFSSSIPEIVMILSSLSKKSYEVSWGTLTGSSIYKLGLIMGLIMIDGGISLSGSLYPAIAMVVFSLIFIIYTYAKIKRKFILIPAISASLIMIIAFLI